MRLSIALSAFGLLAAVAPTAQAQFGQYGPYATRPQGYAAPTASQFQFQFSASRGYAQPQFGGYDQQYGGYSQQQYGGYGQQYAGYGQQYAGYSQQSFAGYGRQSGGHCGHGGQYGPGGYYAAPALPPVAAPYGAGGAFGQPGPYRGASYGPPYGGYRGRY